MTIQCEIIQPVITTAIYLQLTEFELFKNSYNLLTFKWLFELTAWRSSRISKEGNMSVNSDQIKDEIKINT